MGWGRGAVRAHTAGEADASPSARRALWSQTPAPVMLITPPPSDGHACRPRPARLWARSAGATSSPGPRTDHGLWHRVRARRPWQRRRWGWHRGHLRAWDRPGRRWPLLALFSLDPDSAVRIHTGRGGRGRTTGRTRAQGLSPGPARLEPGSAVSLQGSDVAGQGLTYEFEVTRDWLCRPSGPGARGGESVGFRFCLQGPGRVGKRGDPSPLGRSGDGTTLPGWQNSSAAFGGPVGLPLSPAPRPCHRLSFWTALCLSLPLGEKLRVRIRPRRGRTTRGPAFGLSCCVLRIPMGLGAPQPRKPREPGRCLAAADTGQCAAAREGGRIPGDVGKK